MADTASMALDALLRKAQMSDDVEFLREKACARWRGPSWRRK